MSKLDKPAQLQNTIFVDDNAAREALEQVRWPDGPVCPHCGCIGPRIVKVEGTKRSNRPGLYYCNECQGQFTVTVGTVFERSKIPLSKWWMAVYLLNSSKKGISAHQMHRTLKVTYKTAWFMMHRIREAMRTGSLAPMGGSGRTVEIDETGQGRVAGAPPRAPRKMGGYGRTVLTLVERGGEARSFHIEGTTLAQILPVIHANVNRESAVMTDSASWYKYLGAYVDLASHDVINHEKDEYVRREGDKVISTNTVEGYYSIFKRGMKGVYQHCSEKHLHRYLAEFDFRYSHRVALGTNDGERAVLAMKGIAGKRLTYRPTNKQIVQG
jgi:transposase-like protein